MRRKKRNYPLTVRVGGKKHTWKGLVKKYGVKGASKKWKRTKKYHGYTKVRLGGRRRRRNSWKGHKAAHRRAARKGWRRRKYSRRRKSSSRRRSSKRRGNRGRIKYGKKFYSRKKLQAKIGKAKLKKLLKRRGRRN